MFTIVFYFVRHQFVVCRVLSSVGIPVPIPERLSSISLQLELNSMTGMLYFN